MIRLFFIIIFIIVAFYPETSSANFQHIPNMSAEWVRTGNRNAATNSTDIVAYNPAGLSKLAAGFHFNISNQISYRKPTHRYDAGNGTGKRSYRHDGIDWFIPNLYGAFKKDNWSFFLGSYIAGSDGKADYPDGSISTQFLGEIEASYLNIDSPSLPPDWYVLKNQKFKSSSVYQTMVVGGVYAVSDILSLAAGIKYLKIDNTIEMETIISGGDGELITHQFDAEYAGDGFGGVCGLNLTPIKKVNIGVRYESLVKLKVQTRLKKNDFRFDLGSDGEKTTRDFSAKLCAGVACKIIPQLTTEIDVNWYMQKHTKMGNYMGTDLDYADVAGDSYSFGCAAIYDVSPQLSVSAGFLKTEYQFGDIDAYYTYPLVFESLCLDNVYVSSGFSYGITDTIKINFGFGWTHYDKSTIQALKYQAVGREVDVDVENQSFVLAAGLDVSYQ